MRENREFASEIKFQVPEFAGEQILEWARTRLMPDPNACDGGEHDSYRITSLYFDTENFDVYYRNGSFGRSKYRIRRYGPDKTVFLERKLKTRGLVSKRRAAVGIEELEQLRQGDAAPGWPGFWYHQRLQARQLRPICQIRYERIARVAITPTGPIRLTVDRSIETVALQRIEFNDSAPGTPLSSDCAIVEFKFRLSMPVLFKELVESFAIDAKRISKYRMAALALGLVNTPAEEGPKALCLNS